ncbi:MAG: nucleotidyltransferase domain-containing protein, partial [Halobaculum sp.]
AVAVYGSVARGTADQNSDIDVLVITCDRETATTVESEMGTLRLRTETGTRIALAETYSVDEYRESVTSGSDFLGSIRDELHVIYDPERVFRNPEVTSDE